MIHPSDRHGPLLPWRNCGNAVCSRRVKADSSPHPTRVKPVAKKGSEFDIRRAPGAGFGL